LEQSGTADAAADKTNKENRVKFFMKARFSEFSRAAELEEHSKIIEASNTGKTYYSQTAKSETVYRHLLAILFYFYFILLSVLFFIFQCYFQQQSKVVAIGNVVGSADHSAPPFGPT
jgi:hypothetical protein